MKSPLGSSSGFTYIAAIVMVMVIAIMLTKASSSYRTQIRREKEAELIYNGTQIRDAIRSWYDIRSVNGLVVANIPTGMNSFKDLKDLLQDPRSVNKKHHLRRLYKDPMSDKDWILIKDANQKIIGVSSSSDLSPIKQANFPLNLASSDFEGAKKYSDWKFIATHSPTPTAPSAKNINRH